MNFISKAIQRLIILLVTTSKVLFYSGLQKLVSRINVKC